MEREEIKDVLNTSGVPISHLRSRERQTEKGKVLQVPLQVPVQGRELGSSREGINLPSHIAYVIAVPRTAAFGVFPVMYIITALSICQTSPLALPSQTAPQPGLALWETLGGFLPARGFHSGLSLLARYK